MLSFSKHEKLNVYYVYLSFYHLVNPGPQYIWNFEKFSKQNENKNYSENIM